MVVVTFIFAGILAVPSPYIEALKPFKTQAGLSIRSLSGLESVEVNGRIALPPASVAKTVSSACSLWALGPSHQFETTFGYTGSVKAGVLDGDLVITGGGDPSYVIENLKENLERLRVAYGLVEIKGAVVFDTHSFEKPMLEISDEFNGDEGRSFRAWLTPAALDFNSFAVWAVPAFGQVETSILPKEAIELKLNSTIKLQSGTGSSVAVDYQPHTKKLNASGSVGRDGEGKALYRALAEPYESFASLVSRVWKELGGRGPLKSFQVSSRPVRSTALFSHRSQAVSRIFMDINKLSTNFGAEMILLNAGAERFGIPATSDKAKRVLSECLKNYGIAPNRIILENASGLSRKSTLEPSALTEFLARIGQEEFAPEYLSTLSVLGRDGTTKSRLPQHAGRARLKTGSIKDVRTMAGFVYPRKGDPKVFAVFFNCPSCSTESMLRAEDQVLAAMIEGL